jgi:predicted nucleotidyltransferase
MNVVAFGEVYESSLTVRIGQDLNLQITFIPGLVLLKLLAWAPTEPRAKMPKTYCA